MQLSHLSNLFLSVNLLFWEKKKKSPEAKFENQETEKIKCNGFPLEV